LQPCQYRLSCAHTFAAEVGCRCRMILGYWAPLLANVTPACMSHAGKPLV
jgi:hypothetical protein